MTPVLFLLSLFATSIGVGALGAMLGLGGGTLLVPILTMFFGINLHFAMGASLVSVVATSSGGAVGFLRSGLSNIRVGLFLAVPTIIGALLGAILVGVVPSRVLELIFGAAIGTAGLITLRQPRIKPAPAPEADPLAVSFGLQGGYYERALSGDVRYSATAVKRGVVAMFSAGVLSGLLGIGAGALTVLAMNSFMKLPVKVSAATSNFMIGITAAASAGVFFGRGDVHPLIAAPVAVGVLIGAYLGTRVLARLTSTAVRRLFLVVVFYLSVSMILRGLGLL